MDVNGGDDAQNSEDGIVWVMIKHQYGVHHFQSNPNGYIVGIKWDNCVKNQVI